MRGQRRGLSPSDTLLGDVLDRTGRVRTDRNRTSSSPPPTRTAPRGARRGGRYQGRGALSTDRGRNGRTRRASADQRGGRTIWVWIVCASSRPDASVTRVCHTIVVRPRWSGVASARTTPSRPAAKKLVFDSSVVVDAPGGRFRNVAVAPTVSAIAMIVPPCSAPPKVRRSSRIVNSATRRSFEASV